MTTLAEIKKYFKALSPLEKEEQSRRFAEVKQYLLQKDNMITDYVDEVYYQVVGEEVGRR